MCASTATSPGSAAASSESRHYALAFDVGGTTVKSAVVGNDGSRWALPSVPTPLANPHALVELLASIHSNLRRDWPDKLPFTPQSDRLCPTVGVAVPGILDEVAGETIRAANLGWQRFPLRQALSQAMGVAVVLGHDVRTGALGEARFTGRKDCFFVPIGTGISAGIVLNHQLVNLQGVSGEIGQFMLPNPDHNYPGAPDSALTRAQFLPMEQIASAEFTARRFAALSAGNVPDSAAGKAAGSGADSGANAAAQLSSRDVFALAREGNPVAQHVVASGIDALAMTLAASLATLGNLEVILGGGQSREGQGYLQQLQQKTSEYLINLPEPRFSLSSFGSQAQLMGCAVRVFEAHQVALIGTPTTPATSGNPSSTPATSGGR